MKHNENIRNILTGAAGLAMALLMPASCDDFSGIDDIGTVTPSARRVVTPEDRRVLIVYSAGFNSLSSALEEDINDMEQGYLPSYSSGTDIILVYSKRTAGGYSTPTKSYLYRLYKDSSGNAARDTVQTWPETVKAASVQTVSEVLTYVKEHYPASSYGMLFSSHATGWLPSGYYSSGVITASSSAVRLSAYGTDGTVPVPYRDMNIDPSAPRVRSIGADNVSSSSTVEMETEAFAEALPMTFDYILLDACLMGGIEAAYALRDKCHYLVFSPAEILEDGLYDYKTITRHLMQPEPDLTSLCEDSYGHYSALEGDYQSMTISLVDCTRLEPLAEACADIFEKYATAIQSVNASSVQRYFRMNKHWFYDMEDILLQAGVTSEDMGPFTEALNGCMVYKAATDKFLFNYSGFKIEHYSGLSMYLPSDGSSALDSFYKTLSWNQAAGLVK